MAETNLQPATCSSNLHYFSETQKKKGGVIMKAVSDVEVLREEGNKTS